MLRRLELVKEGLTPLGYRRLRALIENRARQVGLDLEVAGAN